MCSNAKVIMRATYLSKSWVLLLSFLFVRLAVASGHEPDYDWQGVRNRERPATVARISGSHCHQSRPATDSFADELLSSNVNHRTRRECTRDGQVESTKRMCWRSLVWENDHLITDVNYTFGLLWTETCPTNAVPLTWVHKWLRNANDAVTDWIRLSLQLEDTADSYNSQSWGLSLYTPNNLSDRMPSRQQGRPYASLLFIGDTVTQVDGGQRERAFSHGFQLAVLGAHLGGFVQKSVHSAFGIQKPEGWPTEISRGGEPRFLYFVEWKRLLLCPPLSSCDAIGRTSDVTVNLRGTVGFYNSVRLGVSGRIGDIKTPFWIDYGSIHLRQGSAQLMRQNGDGGGQQYEYYWLLSTGVEGVVYNALLQGQFRHNRYELDSSAIERLFAYVSTGLVVDLGHFNLTLSYTYRGPEIIGGRDHRWVSIAATWPSQ